MKRLKQADEGFTLVEVLVTTLVLGIVITSLFTLYISLVHSTVIAKRQAVALTLATNQMEYLKSQPYDALAVAGGSIYSANPLPATKTQKLNGVTYTITTSISYIDDAYDGCGSYPTEALKETYCRNYPPPSSVTTTDSNPGDYKMLDVSVTDQSDTHLAELNTEVSARVAETASATGALFVYVIDQNGNPLQGATVHVANSTVSPVVNLSDTTDQNGIAIFYALPPDSKTDYVVDGSKSGYSSLSTIDSFGNRQPTYPNQNIVNQRASYVTLVLKQQGPDSLLIETTDINGNPLPNATIYMKGGYKSYTSTTDTTYYYDSETPCTTTGNQATDGSGFCGVTGLVPGTYIFCGDKGDTGCSANGTGYYLAAALPYGGSSPLNPINVPIYDPNNPPTTTFSYGGVNYLQKVRLMLTPSANFPRVFSLNPYDVSASGSLSNFQFTVMGEKLSCGTGGGCSSTVNFVQNSNTYAATCSGGSGGTELDCSVDLTGITSGTAQLVVGNGNGTLNLPVTPQLGGLSVNP